MSKYSGKCDFCDWIEGYTDEQIAEMNIYQGYFENRKKLDIKCRRDAVPYYPFIVGLACKDKDNQVIVLGEKSYVDYEEREMVLYKLNDFKAYARKCKREKREYTVADALKKCIGQYDEYYKDIAEELAELVYEFGDDALPDGIHLKGYDGLFRKYMIEELVNNGYSKKDAENWVYFGIDINKRY